MTAVFAPPGAYRTAVAELPLSAQLADTPAGSIVVVPGRTGWVDAALAAVAAGAAAVIVAAPAFAVAADIRRMQAGAKVPVVVERPHLRTDSTFDAAAGRSIDGGSTAPRLLVADGGAPRGLVPIVAREALGWLRVLSGGRLALASADGAFALLETADGTAATLSIVVTSTPGGGSFCVRAIGEVLTEVEVDERRTRVSTSTTRGTLSAPDRYESSARLAVRRALAAVESGPTDDLGELLADTELVGRLSPHLA
ncbi:hypothetical protein [Microbacterium terricola]|uniref:Uncharacterized protein n=1 Tax=Microbacterium terricola TaxID=344163 RepID=A0ABM8E1Y8_9MICO|nr:hypothetical protein [Microbacterium terricola]UYK40322.1 hypothetical protein OAU46_01335 [Microbacterium terricola]BDV31964.1 hypothetical protein Microterr_26240 [Microbacterium terricola]